MTASPLINVELSRAYVEIFKVLKESVNALKNSRFDKSEIMKVLEQKSSISIINGASLLIDNLGNSDNIFNLIREPSWEISKVNAVLKSALDLMINSGKHGLKDLQQKLVSLAENFEASKKAVFKINESIKKAVTSSLDKAEKAEFQAFQNDVDLIVNSIGSFKFDPNELKNVLIFDADKLKAIIQEMMLALSKNYLGVLISISNSMASVDGSGKTIDNIINNLGNMGVFMQKAKELNEKIRNNNLGDLKAVLGSSIRHKIDDDISKFLSNEMKFKFSFDVKDFNAVCSLVDKLSVIGNAGDVVPYFGLAEYLVSKKGFDVFVKMNNDLEAIKKMSFFGKINQGLVFVSPQEIMPLINQISSLYSSKVDASMVKNVQGQQLLNQLADLKDMTNYVIKGDKIVSYSKAKDALEAFWKDWKEISKKLKVFDKNATPEEKDEEIKKIKEILDNLNKFNSLFLKNILSYTSDFKDVFSEVSNMGGKNQCILSNEINKVKYYSDLLIVLQKVKNPNTKPLQNYLKNMLSVKIPQIKTLGQGRYLKFFKENKDNENKVFDPQDLVSAEKAKAATEKISKYFNLLKEFAKIIESFMIKSEDLKK